jgi:hypothetical protein
MVSVSIPDDHATPTMTLASPAAAALAQRATPGGSASSSCVYRAPLPEEESSFEGSEGYESSSSSSSPSSSTSPLSSNHKGGCRGSREGRQEKTLTGGAPAVPRLPCTDRRRRRKHGNVLLLGGVASGMTRGMRGGSSSGFISRASPLEARLRQIDEELKAEVLVRECMSAWVRECMSA